MGSETSGLMMGRCLRDDRRAPDPRPMPRLAESRPTRSGLRRLSRPGVGEATPRVEMRPGWLFRVEPEEMRRDADGEGGGRLKECGGK